MRAALHRLWRASALGLALCLASAGGAFARVPAASPPVQLREMPVEAQDTLRLIKRGGPFPYRKDGSVFGNFEKRLPPQPRGYYREYTVPTPGARDRGARRIIAGEGSAGSVGSSGEYYYSADHYKTFRRILE